MQYARIKAKSTTINHSADVNSFNCHGSTISELSLTVVVVVECDTPGFSHCIYKTHFANLFMFKKLKYPWNWVDLLYLLYSEALNSKNIAVLRYIIHAFSRKRGKSKASRNKLQISQEYVSKVNILLI